MSPEIDIVLPATIARDGLNVTVIVFVAPVPCVLSEIIFFFHVGDAPNIVEASENPSADIAVPVAEIDGETAV